MKYISLLYFPVLFVACSSNKVEWKISDFSYFKIKTPYEWRQIKKQGIDSYIGGLTNGRDTLEFEYGRYSPEIGDEDPDKHLLGVDTVNGLRAKLVIPTSPGNGHIGMFIQVNKTEKFSIQGHNIQSSDTVLKIFKSIIFKESDTTLNGKLTASKFTIQTFGTGRSLFIRKCASCHSMSITLNGPPLINAMSERSSDWLMMFFTNRDMVPMDSVRIQLIRQFNGVKCIVLPEITIDEIESIKGYIPQRK